MKNKSFINISLDFKAVALNRPILLEPAKFYFCCSSVVGLLAVPTVFFVFCLLRITFTLLNKISFQEFFFYPISPVQG
jgi:hypothetical protein